VASEVTSVPVEVLHVAEDHEVTAELLNAELPDERFADGDFLRWLYDENPSGPGFHESADVDGVRMAHYAVVAQPYRSAAGPARMVFSLNACTRSTGQRKGWFTTIGERIYARAAEWGALGVVGVSNDNSTPPVVKKLDFRLLGPLPVHVVPAAGRSTRQLVTYRCDERFLAGAVFADLASDLDDHEVDGWVNRWTFEHLRWRLAAPNVASPYWLHATEHLVAITARERLHGVPVAVVLKLLPRGRSAGSRPASRVEPLDARVLVRSACRFHRAPFAVYAGFNRHVHVGGVAPPRRLLPAPLNLIYRSLSPEAPKETITFDTFEFLDMDAY
jgi:hypothetical protein